MLLPYRIFLSSFTNTCNDLKPLHMDIYTSWFRNSNICFNYSHWEIERGSSRRPQFEKICERPICSAVTNHDVLQTIHQEPMNQIVQNSITMTKVAPSKNCSDENYRKVEEEKFFLFLGFAQSLYSFSRCGHTRSLHEHSVAEKMFKDFNKTGDLLE